MIERSRGRYAGRNKASAYRDLVWTVATAVDVSLDIEGQTAATLALLADQLEEMGSDRRSIVSATVYLADMRDKPAMDRIWCDWIGGDPRHWPQRACVGVALEGRVLIEIALVAVRRCEDGASG